MSRNIDYSKFRYLVIDDQPMVRQSLRAAVQTMGGFVVDFAQSYNDAIRRIRANPPDIVLCDYVLGDGRSGQQLLEEVRRFDLLTDDAIYVMVTAEQSYEQVVSAVELVPDDYVLKPFSPELLRLRLDRLVRKKTMLYIYYVAKREKRWDDAGDFIARSLKDPDFAHYKIDLLRCRAELDLLMDNGAAAEQSYQNILDIHEFPWANVGLARALLGQRKLDEARDLIDRVVVNSPRFLAAFDLKANICTQMGDHATAQEVLTDASARSPRNFLRKRSLAAAALANGDTALAQKLMEEVIADDTMPGAVGIADHLDLARSAFDAQDYVTAERAVRRAAAFETMSFEERLMLAATFALIVPKDGRTNFMGLWNVWLTSPMAPERLFDAIRAAFALEEFQLADEIVQRLLNHDGVKAVFKLVREIYARAGRDKEFRDIQKRAALAKISGD